MENQGVDIVVPVWNRPVETRNCLVTLVEHSPTARFILVDNGSDRETERILQEFAEALDHRALLLRNDVNQGCVKAVNRGLARAEAPFVAVVRNTSLVSAAWLEPLVSFAGARPDTGLLLPRLVAADCMNGKRVKHRYAAPIEVDHASLAAMLLTRPLYAAIGGLDEGLDGGEWCLRDYSRRALKAGFLTCRVDGGTVCYNDEVSLGSPLRRANILERSITTFRKRWGETGDFCIHLPKETDLILLQKILKILLQGARYGHRFTVLMPSRLYKGFKKTVWCQTHENITLELLPPLFAAAAARKALSCCRERHAGTVAVTVIDRMACPGVDGSIPFARLEQEIAARGKDRFGL